MRESVPEIAVIFLHHYGGSSRTWDGVIARLPGIRCIAPDLRGFGQSNGHESYELSDYISDVRRLVSTLGEKRFILVGHSMGGKIAMGAAAGGLPGIEALVLLAPSPATPEPISDDARQTLASTLRRAAGVEVVTAAIARPLPADLFAKTVADVNRSAPAAWAAWLDLGSRQDISAEMHNIDVPVLVLSGTKDRNIPTDIVRKEVVERIRGAQLSLIPDAGHLLPLETPATVASAIRTILNERNRRQAREQSIEREARGETTPTSASRYPAGFARALLTTDAVTDATRRAIIPRYDHDENAKPNFFTPDEFKTLHAICARMIPSNISPVSIDLAGAVDVRLTAGMGNGWRYAPLPPDGEFYRRSIHALDQTSQNMFAAAFGLLESAQQDRTLLAIQFDEVGGGLWSGLSPGRFFEELLAEISETYFSHPIVQEQIGYAGMADARGWTRIGLDQLDMDEPTPIAPATEAGHA